MSQTPIYINGIASLSALGNNSAEVWNSLQSSKPLFQDFEIKLKTAKVSALSHAQESQLQDLKNERKLYNYLDKTSLMAIATGRELYKKPEIKNQNIGINIGSSRGATQTFEKAYKQYINQGDVPFMTSPVTTLGNIASSVAQDLGLQGPAISHSITCSSALHALLNASAYLKAGMLNDFIIGGTEAPLTDFTIAQMQALKLYSKREDNFPCRSLDFSKTDNTLVLCEAACLAHVSTTPQKNAIEIAGIGYATEQIEHSVALSTNAHCLQESMQMALQQAQINTVDAIVLHAPGTIKGDQSELKAIENTFISLPALTTNKFLIGHTFGASGAMSLEMAILMLKHNKFVANPFYENSNTPENLNKIMVNAIGFGGNAVSVVLKRN